MNSVSVRAAKQAAQDRVQQMLTLPYLAQYEVSVCFAIYDISRPIARSKTTLADISEPAINTAVPPERILACRVNKQEERLLISLETYNKWNKLFTQKIVTAGDIIALQDEIQRQTGMRPDTPTGVAITIANTGETA